MNDIMNYICSAEKNCICIFNVTVVVKFKNIITVIYSTVCYINRNILKRPMEIKSRILALSQRDFVGNAKKYQPGITPHIKPNDRGTEKFEAPRTEKKPFQNLNVLKGLLFIK